MRLLRCVGNNRVELVDAPDPKPAPDEALVRIEASALCGSERQMLANGAGRSAVGNAGHEAAGIVTWVPPRADVAVGERVGISALRGCGSCAACAAGREMFCASGPRPQMGLHADLVAVGLTTLRRLPAGSDAEAGVLLAGDALGVPARSLRRVPSGVGDRVLVLGLGPVGLSHALVRSHVGSEVLAVEPSAYRRDLAERLGVAATFAPTETVPLAPLVIEATGVAAVVRSSFDRCEPGGTVLQSGECSAVEINPSANVIHKEITYVGSWFYGAEDYPSMLALVGSGLDVGRLVTHTVNADRAQDGVDAFVSAESGKVVLRWSVPC